MSDTAKLEHSFIRYVAATVAAVSLFAVFFFSFPEIDADVSNPVDSEPFAVLARENDEIGIDDLSDFAPLFIPTRWNFVAEKPAIPVPQGWDVVLPNVEKIAFAISDPKSVGEISDSKSVDNTILRAPLTRNFFRDFGRKEQKMSSEKLGGITFALVNLADGKIVSTKKIDGFDTRVMISIAEFMVSVESDGWAIPPLVSQTSGDERTDDALISLLTPSRLLKGVPSGDYKAQFIP